ncbi:hypothetical protein BS78_10G156900 [Paspalum vaginatum]|nr:hypothetical protein BS78_10G156900 [Paspalum vaginatum]
MDRQSATQASGAASTGEAAQEWLYPSSRQPEQAVVDGAFLVELLEDAPVVEQPLEDVDRLTRVIQSLEAEIGGVGELPLSGTADDGSTAEHVPGAFDAGELEDYMLADLDSIPGQCVAEAPFEYWTTEVPPAVGHDMGGWYVDGNGVIMAGYEFRDQYFHGYSESPHVEQVYSPLWE